MATTAGRDWRVGLETCKIYVTDSGLHGWSKLAPIVNLELI